MIHSLGDSVERCRLLFADERGGYARQVVRVAGRSSRPLLARGLVSIAAVLACAAVGVSAQRDELSSALAREAEAGIESGVRFAEGPVRRGRLAASAARVPLRLRRGSCYELVVLTSDVGPIDVVLTAREGGELGRQRGERRIVVSHCASADARATATLGPAPRPGTFALQLFAVNALQRAQ